MKKILLTIAYDGTNYFGWQKQNNKPTVEGEIIKACSKIFTNEFELIGSSRTDRGVHALGQRATIQTEATIPTDRICNALNSNLPDDIVIRDAQDVNLDFHVRYDVKQKTYEYKVFNDLYMIPQLRNFVAFERKKLNIYNMRLASAYFIGEHDFKSFCSSQTAVKTTVRTIYDIQISENNNIIALKITGNGFLYNMVRIIAGTLLYVGLGKIDPKSIIDIINSKDRNRAGKTLVPQGLTLIDIKY